MKRIFCVALIVCLMLTMTACSSGNSEGASDEQASAESTEPDGGAIEVDENLLTVDVTLPASYFEDTTEEDVRAGAEENGFKNVVFNADGSVTYTMTKAQHREVLESYKATVDTSLDDMLNGEEAIESFQKISYNEDMSEFTVQVDPTKYSEWDTLSVIVFYFSGMYYQAFNGVSPEDNHVVVNFVDMNTGEVLDTADSANLGE